MNDWHTFAKHISITKGTKQLLIELSKSILDETLEDLKLDMSMVHLKKTCFSINVPKKQKRRVFVCFVFNVNSLKVETMYFGQKTINAKYIEKKSHKVNTFKLSSRLDSTQELIGYIRKAFQIIDSGDYDLYFGH